eukprot:8257927-Heterocapsa_arctica.AAC.1
MNEKGRSTGQSGSVMVAPLRSLIKREMHLSGPVVGDEPDATTGAASDDLSRRSSSMSAYAHSRLNE